MRPDQNPLDSDHPKARELAEPNTILRVVVGSTVHGLSIEGTDDRDEMGVCVEPPEHFFGLRDRFEQWTHRTQPEGHRSGPGDLDLTIYSLAKWARLALNGNPTILALLFVPERHTILCDAVGRQLLALAPEIIGDQIYGPYLGYMEQQRRRLTEKVKMPRRPELVERYGYDTKYAGHLIRLGYQGVEMAETGRMTLPMVEPTRTRILAIRTGKVPELEVLAEAEHLENRIVEMRDTNPLPPANRALVEEFVIDTYRTRHLYFARPPKPGGR